MPKRTKPIPQWKITRIEVLTGLKVFVQDDPDSPERELSLESTDSTPKTCAVVVALLRNLTTGLDDKALDKAMNEEPLFPKTPAVMAHPDDARDYDRYEESARQAIQTQISHARTALGFQIVKSTGRYRIRGLEPGQVDAVAVDLLVKHVLHLATKGLECRAELREKCQAAVDAWEWTGDPVEIHAGYLRTPEVFSAFKGHYLRIRSEYVRVLVADPEVSEDDLRLARLLVDHITAVDPEFEELDQLNRALARARPVDGPPTTPGTRPTPIGGWINDYRAYLARALAEIDLRSFGSAVTEAPLEALYRDSFVAPGPGEVRAEGYRHLLTDVISSTPKAVVVGDSGSGKSTFLQHYCRRLLESDSEGRLPVLVDLVELNDAEWLKLDRRNRAPWDTLLQAFARQLRQRGIEVELETLAGKSRDGRVVWLLDGLNEIASERVRVAVANIIGENASQAWSASEFILTTTPWSLSAHTMPRGFVAIYIDRLQPEDVESFLDGFASELYPELSAEERRVEWESLATTITKSRDLRTIAGLPLYLTAIALIYFKEHRLVGSRDAVLEAATSWLIKHRAPILVDYVASERDVEDAFALLGHAMVTAPGGVLTRIGRKAAVDVLEGSDLFDSRKKALEFIEAAANSGGLVTPRGTGDLGMLDAFRDFLAAKWIAGLTDDEEAGWWREVRSRLDDPDWRHVLGLVPARLHKLGSSRVDLFLDRLALSCSGKQVGVRVGRVALGGAVLQELMTEGYRAPLGSRWEEEVAGVREIFVREISEIPLQVRFDAAVAYGLMGDDRLTDFPSTWAWMEGGALLVGAQSEDESLPNYDRDAAPWEGPPHSETVAPFGIRRFPITVMEFEQFVDADGYVDPDCVLWAPDGSEWRATYDIRLPLDWDEQLLVPNAPVTGVSFHEATAYCNWLTNSKDARLRYRLPTEVEWEFGARRGVVPGRRFPWGDRMTEGDEAEANWAGCHLRRKSPVGLFPRSSTIDRVVDLYGNVEEWTLDEWDTSTEEWLEELVRPGAPKYRAPDRITARSAGGWTQPGTKRIVRGGSCIRFSRLCRPTYRSRIGQEGRYHTVGFRPVAIPVA